jgi:hypothetical protein
LYRAKGVKTTLSVTSKVNVSVLQRQLEEVRNRWVKECWQFQTILLFLKIEIQLFQNMHAFSVFCIGSCRKYTTGGGSSVVNFIRSYIL